MANLIEYVLATDPKKRNAPSDSITTSTASIEVDGTTQTYFTLTYAQRISADGVTVTLETSNDLKTWTSPGLVMQSATVIDATRERVVMRSEAPVGTAPLRHYARIKATEQ